MAAIISIPSYSDYTSIDIYRSENEDDVYSTKLTTLSTPVASYTDSTAELNKAYYYGLVTTKKDGTVNRSITFCIYNRENWGPCTDEVNNRIVVDGTPWPFGGRPDGKLGIISQVPVADVRFPTFLDVGDSWKKSCSEITGLPESSYGVSTNAVDGQFFSYDDKLSLFRWHNSYGLNLGSRAKSWYDLTAEILQLAKGFEEMTSGTNVITYGGHRWKLRFLTKELYDKFPTAFTMYKDGYPQLYPSVLKVTYSTSGTMIVPDIVNDKCYLLENDPSSTSYGLVDKTLSAQSTLPMPIFIELVE